MSKGFGNIQRSILDTLPCDRPVDTFEIAALAYGVTSDIITASQRAATFRALARLEASGKVAKLFIGRHGRTYWGASSYAPGYFERASALMRNRLPVCFQ
jgi:hypothetical protein